VLKSNVAKAGYSVNSCSAMHCFGSTSACPSHINKHQKNSWN